MLGMVVAPRKSWLPGGSEAQSFPLTAVTGAHSLELCTGGHTSLVAYFLVLVSMTNIPGKEY